MKKISLLTSALLLSLTFLFLFSCSKEQGVSSRESTTLTDDSNGAFSNSGIAGNGLNGAGYDYSGEGYNEYEENPFISTYDEAVSTFSIDADGGSYSNARRFLEDGIFPPKEAIRTEEILNFFQYDYPEPYSNHPIALQGEITTCPWTNGHNLLRIGIKGKHIAREDMPPANFVFLIDVSGSMNKPDKLGLLKEGFILYADYMRPQDKIAIVTYAGTAGVLLESTPGDQKQVIKNAIAQLGAGGSTNGAGGIIKAYEIASANFIDGGNNRVILGTDGDFNVGVSGQDELVTLIEEKRESGVFLSVLGVGSGNYQDGKMEQLANNGNGTYEYIDDIEQAQKVFVEEFGKFYTVAKDVKIQVKFDPTLVLEYRLIGYENRVLNEEDFEDDTKDAGEIGADQRITALYELVMAPAPFFNAPSLTIDFRYKLPDEDVSTPMFLDVYDQGIPFDAATENTRFAIATAGYGLMFRNSEYNGELTWDDLLSWVSAAKNYDPNGYRTEFLQWIQKAKDLE